MDEAAWTKLLWEQGPIVAILGLFITAAATGRIRFAREFKALEDINLRWAEVVRENSRTTGEAVRALKEAIEALKEERRGKDAPRR